MNLDKKVSVQNDTDNPDNQQEVIVEEYLNEDDGEYLAGSDNNESSYQLEQNKNNCEDELEELEVSDNNQKEYEINNNFEDPEELFNNDNSSNDQNNDYDNNSDNDVNTEYDTNAKLPVERKKHGLPKTLMNNQRKYLEALEREQKALNKNKHTKDKKKLPTPQTKMTTTIPPNTRRVMVAGKVRYLPIEEVKDEPFLQTKQSTTSLQKKAMTVKEPSPVNQRQIQIIPSATQNIPVTTENIPLTTQSNEEDQNIGEDLPVFRKQNQTEETTSKEKRIPATIAKKMEIRKELAAKSNATPKKTKLNKINHRVPSKYAKQIENNVKTQTIRNAKSFSDLRKIKAMQEIEPTADIDTSKASITELRKLRIEQKKREMAEQKKKMEANKRDTVIQEILKNDKMSKFAKTVAIANLSVNKRNRRMKLLQNNNQVTN